MTNKTLRLVVSLAVSILLSPHSVEAQQAGEVYRVGWVTTGRVPFLAHFRDGMRELGYAEGQNLVILERYADGKAERQPGLLAELLSLNGTFW